MRVLGKVETSKKQVSIRLPEKMLNDINQAVVEDGVSLKRRSAWISDAIIALKDIPNCCELVLEEWVSRSANKPLQVTLTADAISALETIKTSVSSQDKRKGENSAVIRTAMIQKLIFRKTGLMKTKTD